MSLAETVLNIIYDEKLQENAQLMGEYVMQRLIELKSKYNCIGDVRWSLIVWQTALYIPHVHVIELLSISLYIQGNWVIYWYGNCQV